MLPIVLFSHGSYSAATKETAEMIIGDLEKVYVLSVEVGSSVTQVEEELENIIKEYNGDVIVLCDILGGTPSNISFKMKQKYKNVLAYTGFNLPVVLELIFNRDGTTQDIKDVIEMTYSNGLNEIKYVTTEKNNNAIVDL